MHTVKRVVSLAAWMHHASNYIRNTLCSVPTMEVVETNVDTKLFKRKLSNFICKSSSADGEVLW